MSEKINIAQEDIVQEDIAVEERKSKLGQPPLYKVLLINDDYTPMNFVVDILEMFFHMNGENAARVMLEVHTSGKGLCGTYTHEIAETKVMLVNEYSQEHKHPLLCTMEAV